MAFFWSAVTAVALLFTALFAAAALLASACLSLSESFLLLSFFLGQSLTMWPILPQDLQPRSLGGWPSLRNSGSQM